MFSDFFFCIVGRERGQPWRPDLTFRERVVENETTHAWCTDANGKCHELNVTLDFISPTWRNTGPNLMRRKTGHESNVRCSEAENFTLKASKKIILKIILFFIIIFFNIILTTVKVACKINFKFQVWRGHAFRENHVVGLCTQITW